jgi:hypothetical protein
VAPGSRLFVIRCGYIGMAPGSAQPGDEVMLVREAWAPYVFRPVNMSKGDDGWGLEEEVRILIGEGRPMSMV